MCVMDGKSDSFLWLVFPVHLSCADFSCPNPELSRRQLHKFFFFCFPSTAQTAKLFISTPHQGLSSRRDIAGKLSVVESPHKTDGLLCPLLKLPAACCLLAFTSVPACLRAMTTERDFTMSDWNNTHLRCIPLGQISAWGTARDSSSFKMRSRGVLQGIAVL